MRTRTGQPKNGFTLVEALVAISILMIAIASPMTIAQKGLSDALLSQDDTTASFLAQDAIEAVKNARDDLAIAATSSGDWLSTFRAYGCVAADQAVFANFTTYCNVDTTASALVFVPSTNASEVNPLKIQRSNGDFLDFYLSSAGTAESSKFSRYVDILQSAENPDEAEVQVKVSWNSQFGPQSVTIKDFIYNYAANL